MHPFFVCQDQNEIFGTFPSFSKCTLSTTSFNVYVNDWVYAVISGLDRESERKIEAKMNLSSFMFKFKEIRCEATSNHAEDDSAKVRARVRARVASTAFNLRVVSVSVVQFKLRFVKL